MKKYLKNSAILLSALIVMSGCTQQIPSIMNNSKPELAHETVIEQIPLNYINETTVNDLAAMYKKTGNGVLDLTMVYDPKSSSFTAMNAVHELKKVKAMLGARHVGAIDTQTMAVPDGKPALIVSYNSITASAPSDCPMMPGIEDRRTDRDLGGYRLGCGTETLISRQIARPADLAGNTELGPRDARRESVITNEYLGGVPRESLEGLDRGNL